MSKGKVAKTASKNNPNARSQAKAFFFNDKKIRPVKLITTSGSYMAAEYEDSGKLVLGKDGSPIQWRQKQIS